MELIVSVVGLFDVDIYIYIYVVGERGGGGFEIPSQLCLC